MDLIQRSELIETEDIKIKDFWTNFTGKDKCFPNSLRIIYSTYLSHVRNVVHSSSSLLEINRFAEYENRQKSQEDGNITNEILGSPDNILLDISIAGDKAGKLLNISSNISDLLGWTKTDLIGKNLSLLFPCSVEDMVENRGTRTYKQVLEKDTTRFKKNMLLSRINRYTIPCKTYSGFTFFNPRIVCELIRIP